MEFKKYTDPQTGAIFEPQICTEAYVMYRADHHNHIQIRVHKIDQVTDTVNTTRVAKRFGGSDSTFMVEGWLRENSESMPQKIYPKEVINAVKEAKGEPIEGIDYERVEIEPGSGLFIRKDIEK